MDSDKTVSNGDSKPVEEEPPKIEEIVTPSVIKQIIQGYNPQLNLVSWKAELGSKIGDNYMSILYAVELELEGEHGANETLQVMLKTLPRNVYRADMISEMKAFKKEATLYQDVFPVYIELQEERNIPNEDLFQGWPKCYAVHLDGRTDYLALENLKVSGYRMGIRAKGLDFNHCALLLRTLARYHAISFAKWGGSREKILKDFPLLSNSMFDKNAKTTEMQQQFFSQSLNTTAEGLKEHGEELASSRAIKLAEADICGILGDMATKNIDHAVIIHGDSWVNNIMFQYRSNDETSSHPIGAKLIDFQICVAASRLIDVFYFLLTSCQLEVLNEREEDLLMIYFAEFTSFAERLGVNTKESGLTWENFLKEGEEFRLYGVIIGLLFAPMLAAASEKIPDMESFSQEEFENVGKAVQTFYKELTDDGVTLKLKSILLNQLPKCINAKEFL